MLTGFADFDYAREALRLGTLNYLLKPVTPEDLSACMSEAFEKHCRAAASLSLVFESELVSMETRMLKAKELLLSDSGLKVQQVTEEVGYYSTRHLPNCSRNITASTRRKFAKSRSMQKSRRTGGWPPSGRIWRLA